nr:nucleoside phosphorylase [Candidatus Sigynarchaeota archaeon]
MKRPETHEIAKESSTMGDFPVYETVRGGRKIIFFHPGLGAPLCASILEFVIQLGCKKFIAIGSAGAVRGDIPPGNLIVPVAAIRDEGTSYHYLAPSREVSVCPAVLEAIETGLEHHHVPYIKAKTWTTDAYYRETLKKIEHRRDEGCATVEMETSALLAVAQFRNVKLGQILYCDDDVSDRTWKFADMTDPSNLRWKLLDLAVDICYRL